jgi:hypothetical protein
MDGPLEDGLLEMILIVAGGWVAMVRLRWNLT